MWKRATLKNRESERRARAREFRAQRRREAFSARKTERAAERVRSNAWFSRVLRYLGS
jgi:hypothetical protein